MVPCGGDAAASHLLGNGDAAHRIPANDGVVDLSAISRRLGLVMTDRTDDPLTGHDNIEWDSEDQPRCATCEKWLEPPYYTLKDHRKDLGLGGGGD